MEESWFGFWKAKETALLKKRQKSAFSKAGKDKGEGKPTLSMRWFPLSLFIYPKLCSFAPAPKNAVHFLYGAVLHRPGGTPGPLSLFCANALCQSYKKCSFLRLFAGFRLGVFSRLWEPEVCVRIWLGAFGKAGLF